MQKAPTRGLFLISLLSIVATSILLLFSCRTSNENIIAGLQKLKKPNVLLITVDTTRADHLPAYGYKNIRTPNLDSLAKARNSVSAVRNNISTYTSCALFHIYWNISHLSWSAD